MQPILVSACLLGLLTRYDGKSKRNQVVIDYLRREQLLPIPVCPEQLAGLPTPRPRTCFAQGDGATVLDGNGKVVRAGDGTDLSEIFLKGAIETMKVARFAGCTRALLKERSPSCGVRAIYRGEAIRSGQGVTAALLRRNGVEVFSEEEL